MKEERKENVGGRRTKVAGNGEEFEGRVRAEKERKGREVEIGGRRKAMCDNRENNTHTG